jgi:hypothetical protein
VVISGALFFRAAMMRDGLSRGRNSFAQQSKIRIEIVELIALADKCLSGERA